MKKVVSVSGGKTSAYIAANYEADYYVFALVRTDDQDCAFPDRQLASQVEDRLQAPFIGTTEEDAIIYTIFDLEQHIGKKINWVTGETFDELIHRKGGYLPNRVSRYCTTDLKIKPMFDWWYANFSEPIEMQIGFRANELSRAKNMLAKTNEDGLSEFNTVVGKRGTQNKWASIAWQKPNFPLIEDNIYKEDINRYWLGKPVRFAKMNNCVGCFWRNPLLLRKRFEDEPTKMEWFLKQEKKGKGTWRTDADYQSIKDHHLQAELFFDDFSSCDSGYCGF